jgi:hypothetical protein
MNEFHVINGTMKYLQKIKDKIPEFSMPFMPAEIE